MEQLRVGDPEWVGRYRLVGRLGGGGMGQVFLGRSPGGRPVAVKLVRPELAGDAGFRRRFAAEVAAARRVGGFYTAQLVDSDTNANPPWLVTAYVPGPSLQEAIQTHGPLPATALSVLGGGLAEGLAAIHDCGLVHRDLKPGNVILAADGPRVIDFGISRSLDASQPSSSIVGTPAYMSPEQGRGAPVGPESDVFSLGSVLAFAATGHSPFGTGPAHAIIYRIIHDQPDPAVLAGVPTPLADLITACLNKNPSDRPTLAAILSQLAQAPHVDSAADWLPPPFTTMIIDRQTHTPAYADPAVSPPGPVESVPSAPDPQRPIRHSHLPQTTAGSGTRRRLLLGAALTGVVGILGVLVTVKIAPLTGGHIPLHTAGQAPGTAKISGTVYLWDNSEGSPPTQTPTKLITAFQAKYPTVTVHRDPLAYDSAMSKLRAACTQFAGRPDVYFINLAFVSQLAAWGCIAPLDGTPALEGSHGSVTTYSGKAYALSAGSSGFAYCISAKSQNRNAAYAFVHYAATSPA